MPYWYQQCRSAILVIHSLIGMSLFSYALRRRRGLAWRLPAALLLAVVTAFEVQRALYVPGITFSAIVTQGVVALINYTLVLLVGLACLDESFWSVLFVTTSGVTVQGLAGCVKTLFKLIPAVERLALDDAGILLVDLVCYGGSFVLVFLIFRSFTGNREEIVGNRSRAVFSTCVLVFYMANSWLSRDYTNGQSVSYILVSNIYAIFVQAMIYAVQFDMMERDRMSRYIEVMRELLHEQRSQYESSRESVQLINEKYHDLKNLIGSIQGTLPAEELDRLKSSIERYDVHVHTGYEVLDVVLTEKMDLCLQRGITMTCNLGRTDFGFMEELDLYTLFHNALANAVNAVSQLPEGRGKYIVLAASQDHNMLTIHMENPCEKDLQFVDGLPQTSKDTDWHGFGMKSMARTAEKYGGALSVSQENGKFQLDILLLDEKN